MHNPYIFHTETRTVWQSSAVFRFWGIWLQGGATAPFGHRPQVRWPSTASATVPTVGATRGGRPGGLGVRRVPQVHHSKTLIATSFFERWTWGTRRPVTVPGDDDRGDSARGHRLWGRRHGGLGARSPSLGTTTGRWPKNLSFLKVLDCQPGCSPPRTLSWPYLHSVRIYIFFHSLARSLA